MNILCISLFAFISFTSAFASEESAVCKETNSSELAFSIDAEDNEKNPFFIMIVQDLREELRLRPYRNALLGSDILLRPIFPEDYEGISVILMDPKSMQYFQNGKTKTLAEIKK